MRTPLALTIAAASALALTGCANVIDADKLEDEIQKDAEAAGVVVDEVDCPEADAKEGESFFCTVTVKGEPRELEVLQQDDDGNVTYNLSPLLAGGESGVSPGGDEASISTVIEAVNTDPAALCDYATDAYRKEIVDQTGQKSCEDAVAGDEPDPIEEYKVMVSGDTASVEGTDSSGPVVVTLDRAEDGTWEISAIE